MSAVASPFWIDECLLLCGLPGLFTSYWAFCCALITTLNTSWQGSCDSCWGSCRPWRSRTSWTAAPRPCSVVAKEVETRNSVMLKSSVKRRSSVVLVTIAAQLAFNLIAIPVISLMYNRFSPWIDGSAICFTLVQATASYSFLTNLALRT